MNSPSDPEKTGYGFPAKVREYDHRYIKLEIKSHNCRIIRNTAP